MKYRFASRTQSFDHSSVHVTLRIFSVVCFPIYRTHCVKKRSASRSWRRRWGRAFRSLPRGRWFWPRRSRHAPTPRSRYCSRLPLRAGRSYCTAWLSKVLTLPQKPSPVTPPPASPDQTRRFIYFRTPNFSVLERWFDSEENTQTLTQMQTNIFRAARKTL